MPILVDPRTGEQYDYDGLSEQDQANDQKRFGLQPLDEYQRVKAAEAEGQLKSGARVAAQTLLAIPEALTKIDPFQPAPEELSPDAQAYLQGQEAQLQEFAGKAKGAAEAYPVTGMAAAALPAVGAGIAAAPLATGALGTIATEAAVGATLGEAGAAATEGREVSAKGALYNGVLGAGFAGLGLGLGKAYRAVSGRVVEPLMQATERAVQRRIPRALAKGGEELADPEVAARAGEVVGQRIDATMGRIDDAINQAQPVVANNPRAQREAMRGLADQMREAQPEIAGRLEELAGKPRAERFRGLLDIQSSNPEVSKALDELRGDAALWGDKAVAHGQALSAARAARPSGAGAYLEALQGFDDPSVSKLASELSQRLDERGGIEAAQAFREARSVGAAGNGPELMPASEVSYFVKNDDKIVDNLRTMAGGGEGEKGAFQHFVESFRKVTANRIKRDDFRAFAPELSEETRAALHAERDAIVDGVPEVVEALTSRGAKKAAGRVTELATELSKADTGEIAPLLDQLKQQYDDINIRAVRDPNDPLHNLKETIDPNVERIRAALENPQYVGEKIAELQQVRNAAWSDRETGFIHNMKVANELGPRIFKKIDVDYHTGDLVMQFDPGAFKQLLNMDWHESKPVLEAWAKALDSAERMAANTTEVGAQSAARGPLGQLQTSIGKLRQIFEAQSKRFIAKDIAQGGLDALAIAEQLPVVGKFVQAGRKFGGGRLEGAIAGARAQYVPIPTRSAAAAAEELGAIGGPARRAPVGREPTPPVPEPPEPGAPAAAAPVGEMRKTSVGANDAASAVREAAAARQRQAGAVVVQGEATPRIDKLSTKVRDAVEKYRALKKRGVDEGRLQDAAAAVDSRLHDLRDEYESRIASLLDGRSPEELGPIARAKYMRLTNGLGELEGVLGQHGGKLEKVGNAEIYSIGNPVESAESWLRGRQTVDTEAGHVTVGDLATSPLAVASGAGLAGLGAYKAYQLSHPTPEQAQRDTALQLLQQHADQDLEDTARALTDPDYAARWARQSRELPGTLETFQGVNSTLQQAYQERRQAIERAAADPNYLIDHATEAFGDLPPEVALKGFEISQYLAQELPPKRGVTVTRPNGLPPDPLEVRSWALKYQTATDPSTAFDDAKRGTLRHEQVQTLKQIWPERYDQLRTMTLLAMGNGKSTVNQRMRADLLFGFGSTLDPAFSRRLSAAARPAYEQRSKAAGSPGGAVQSRMPAAMTPGGIGALQLGASAPMGQ